ncbi:putative oxidoreductase [Streptomyces scabiei 87.22]|uniref:Putative oxidoreductase n=3 Tax=Streptomyces scabiei TaxID=1930 RepID=C9Z6G3_STRSW|nr:MULTISPECIES: LLM class flavin-dependent oxidoreductase [Streptomyces]MBP5934079.1 LLM class flavin-dependent oxidoreductase [Streptomyces sp. LBUM 1479]MBP5873287.1 LLM class flavin-dependent oxidoreductase [Streptomyces sp. LBUM 1477]MBP5896146.1 LLM class flavin-dependent oxidoreductase [Streptomyces sp. LBUM 1481]MBP5896726.1 LLM class flavin-dependent oxidoreductase [Streptomyces sp. LBUM 1488]MBP5911068.1 LLM class flavin-dependent oxidoreductase [Streptomyces sp. LBUM 1486]
MSQSPARPARGAVGVMLPLDLPVAQVLPYVRRAEELGFDQVWVVEDLGWRGGVAQAATVLASTTKLTVGIGIMPAGARNVCFAAMELATLAQLHPGRLIAGIGHGMPGWMRQAGSWPASPLTLIKEYARALRLLVAGEPGPENGRYVRCEGVVITEVPDVVPPVILGVRGPKSQAVAGEVADGLLLAEPAAPGYITASLRHLGPAAAHSPEIVVYDAAAVDDDEEAALARVRTVLESVGEPQWAAHVDPLPFAAELRAHRAACSDGRQFARTMPAEWVRALSISGTPAQARAAIDARHAAGATSVVLAPAGPDPLAALDALARALPPRH